MTDLNGSAAAGNPADAGNWIETIPDAELRGFVQTKGWKDPGAMADGYRNLEKLMGAPKERLLRLPEKEDAPEWSDIWGRLGRPEKPEDYGLSFEGDAAFAERFSGVMHKAGIPKSAAQLLNQEWNAYVQEMIDGEDREWQAREKKEMEDLRGRWGADFDKHAEFGRRAGLEFGLSEEQFAAVSRSLGPGKTLELFHTIGQKLGEARPFEGDGRSQIQLTREQALHQIQTLKSDPDFVSRYLQGGQAEKDKLEALAKIASK
jgi:hypothetical protein